jgi:hypothetical protein
MAEVVETVLAEQARLEVLLVLMAAAAAVAVI